MTQLLETILTENTNTPLNHILKTLREDHVVLTQEEFTEQDAADIRKELEGIISSSNYKIMKSDTTTDLLNYQLNLV